VRTLAGTVATVMIAALGAQPSSATPDAPVTLTARIAFPTVARQAPRDDAARVAGLTGTTTYSHRAQVLMVTGRLVDPTGAGWVRVRLPERPNGAAGWVPLADVRLAGTRQRIVVDLGARTLEVWRGSTRLASWNAGVGRAQTPTPTGHFAISDALRTLPAWRGVYGEHTITLTAHSSVLQSFMGGNGLVAIHGGSAGRVGRASSNGCVLLSAPHLARLRRYALPGTPVIIRP
jgi:lipoprotein-anchoring transpeptidase ErfK/SrfK